MIFLVSSIPALAAASGRCPEDAPEFSAWALCKHCAGEAPCTACLGHRNRPTLASRSYRDCLSDGICGSTLANLCEGRQGLLTVFGRLQMLDWCGASLLQSRHRGPQLIEQWASNFLRNSPIGRQLVERQYSTQSAASMEDSDVQGWALSVRFLLTAMAGTAEIKMSILAPLLAALKQRGWAALTRNKTVASCQGCRSGCRAGPNMPEWLALSLSDNSTSAIRVTADDPQFCSTEPQALQ